MTRHLISVTTSYCILPVFLLLLAANPGRARAQWNSLFDGRSLAGWRASGQDDTWVVEDGNLTAEGDGVLYYAGTARKPISGISSWRRSYDRAGLRGGILFRTADRGDEAPAAGYEVCIDNAPPGTESGNDPARTGSLMGLQHMYHSGVEDGQWFQLRMRVIENRVRIWVNNYPTVDHLLSSRTAVSRRSRTLERGTFGLRSSRRINALLFAAWL